MIGFVSRPKRTPSPTLPSRRLNRTALCCPGPSPRPGGPHRSTSSGKGRTMRLGSRRAGGVSPPVGAAVYDDGCQVPPGVFCGGADRPRRRPRAESWVRPCSSPEHSFPAAALPSPAAGGGRREKNAPRLRPGAPSAVRGFPKRLRSAGVRLGPGARPERPSIRVGPATAPSTWYRIRLERPARQQQEPTHRTNGAFTGSPGGTTAALPDLAWPPGGCSRAPDPSASIGSALDTPPPSHGAAAAAALACRRAVELTRSRQSFSSAPGGSSPCSA